MCTIYLVRHGATAANILVPYRLQGRRSDLSLAPIGWEQARRAADTLEGLTFRAIYASPLQRAIETARTIARPHGLDIVPVPELTEADVGRWEGLTWEEVHEADPERYRAFMANPGTVPYPDGESFEQVGHRVTPAFAQLAAAHRNERIVVVAHNVVNRAFLGPILGLPIDRARALRQANGGINVIEYLDDSPRVMTLNAVLHLEGLTV